MSDSGSDPAPDSGSDPGRREVAYRLFAAEFDDSELSYSESDEERAPNYVVTPTGARVNRLFAVGVLTEVGDVNPEMVRGRLVDPTGAFVTYAGQYQPEALAVLERADPPAFFSLSGKARTYEPDDGDRIYSSVRPETVSEVDAETRDRWVATAAERTLERIGVMASAIESGLVGDQLRAALAEAGVDERLADGVALAVDYYGTTPAYLAALKGVALEAVEVVAGERGEVSALELAPEEGAGDASDLATTDLAGAPTPESAAAAAGVGSADGADDAETDAVGEPDTPMGSASASDPGTAPEPTTPSETGSGSATETAPQPDGDPLDDSTAGSGSADDDGLAEPEDVDPGEFELDESERQAVEEEYGTEFSTADEVEPADIEPEGSAGADSEPATGAGGTEAEGADDVEVEGDDDAESVDLDETVVTMMGDLDDGDGADRDDLVSAVVDAHGVDPAAVEDAIQDALMSGQCYEPSDGTLKRI